MTVAYPRKLRNAIGARQFLADIVGDRELHMITLNRYRYSEQRSCQDLTDAIERLDGEPAELVRDLSRHISDEARHAMWLTDLLVDLGQNVGTPPGVSYIDEFERLLDSQQKDPAKDREDFVISAIAAINVSEKRVCEYFSAHIHVLKQAPQTAENVKIRETIEKIFPEEAGHVRWGNRCLAQIADKSPEHRQKVEQAKRKYVAIEQAAYESGRGYHAGGRTPPRHPPRGYCQHHADVGTPAIPDGTLAQNPAGPGPANDQSRCSSAGLEPRPAGIYGEIGADVPQRLEYHWEEAGD